VIVNVPNESVGLVIGKQGATIKMLEGQSGARIQIAKECPPGNNMRPITVTGPPNCVEHAKQLILGKVSGVSIFCLLIRAVRVWHFAFCSHFVSCTLTLLCMRRHVHAGMQGVV
jgi:hypothetical protein